MLMPGRKYTAPNSSYRYGFNGQEKSTEIDDNLTTAEFWEYDSRIGRRWNLDPTPDISLSPYATFGNNPILNIDPYGDTLSNPQLRDAAKIASTEIKKRIDNNQGFGLLSKNYLNPLNASITNYVATNKITGQDQVDFYSNVQAYYSGYADVGMMSKGDFMQLNRLINNAGVGDARALRLTQASINYNHSQLLGILNISANVAVGEAAGAIGTPVGARPKGPQPRLPFAANSSVPLVEYNGGMSYIYRGDNGSSPLFR
jgi:RHS repeat-associated protein